MQTLEHPEVTRALRTGYPKPVPPVRLIGKCSCGCGEEVTNNYSYVEVDDDPYIDDTHAIKALRKQGRWVEVG